VGERCAESIFIFVVAYFSLVLVLLVVKAVEKRQMPQLGLLLWFRSAIQTDLKLRNCDY